MRKPLRFWATGGILMLAAMGALALYLAPGFGAAPQGERKAQVERSPNYRDGAFQNEEPTRVFTGQGSQWAAWGEFLFKRIDNLKPERPLPLVHTDIASLDKNDDLALWLGHSSWYLQLAGKRILIDPVFSGYASPFALFNRAFAGDYPWTAQSMPDIDLLVISHDHYDHLDYATVRALRPKIRQVITPLGVGAHLEAWGVAPSRIKEVDWQQSVNVADGLTVHALPARHFSGRGLKGNQTLWASFLFETPQQKLYYSGDSGYGPHFKATGERFGGVDIAIMENGQYDRDWSQIHMMPEETAQAAQDLGAKRVLPGHNGRFAMAKHAWNDPLKRLAAASRDKAYTLLTPRPGEPVRLAQTEQHFSAWWEDDNVVAPR
ncbi:MBL fold metallo-hydrolase [Franconibacter helveticus]|uniref:MBL fold metallo-hydrolase n=2 Tax=Franconibacter helveticus TaxID=357240 RepID=UPI000DA1D93C|nr:MBL fold metallo-hydrolase [Franconibacter helveticus]